MPINPPTLLVVDDEPDMCWLVQSLLHKHGFSSQSATNGSEALAQVRRCHFSIIFLDIKLPDIEGLELARRIRELDNRSSIIVLSGYFYHHDVAVQQALSDGLIAGFIAKPFQHHDIINIIYCLNNRKKPANE